MMTDQEGMKFKAHGVSIASCLGGLWVTKAKGNMCYQGFGDLEPWYDVGRDVN